MSYDQKFLETQKENLLKEREKIEDKVKKLKKYPDYGTDDEDKLQEMEDYENNLSIEGQLEFLLEKIKKALKTIEDGTYGQCLECKKNIEEGRLKIMPYAELCITCKNDSKNK